MSLKENTSKDTSIKLILQGAGPMEGPRGRDLIVHPAEYYEIDLTEPILDALQGFDPISVLGISYEIEGVTGGKLLCHQQWRLVDQICSIIGGVLDAAIVNEKQRRAIDALIYTKVSDMLRAESNSIDWALKELKK